MESGIRIPYLNIGIESKRLERASSSRKRVPAPSSVFSRHEHHLHSAAFSVTSPSQLRRQSLELRLS
ncbi:hypothetical protein PIB30_021662 [Stylosanthes scabra]|uniref:Uncharacterized protein n=1 Tax=Stylosanthes scabra TaxID=79078 RepID=A0ABU6Y8J6_9FABA|nr:hypothetical protein [Stylosanthes scabra]